MAHKKTISAASVILFMGSLFIFFNPQLIHAQNTSESQNLRTQIKELKKQVTKEKEQILSLKEKQKYFTKKMKELQIMAEKINNAGLLKKTEMISEQEEKGEKLAKEEKRLAEEKLKQSREGPAERQEEDLKLFKEFAKQIMREKRFAREQPPLLQVSGLHPQKL
jgi:ferredoxin-NADP reductase